MEGLGSCKLEQQLLAVGLILLLASREYGNIIPT